MNRIRYVGQTGLWNCYRTGKQTLVSVEVILEKTAKLSNGEFVCLRDGENLHRSGAFLIEELANVSSGGLPVESGE